MIRIKIKEKIEPYKNYLPIWVKNKWLDETSCMLLIEYALNDTKIPALEKKYNMKEHCIRRAILNTLEIIDFLLGHDYININGEASQKKLTKDSHIKLLGLKARTLNALNYTKITYIKDLYSYKVYELMSLPNFGKSSLDDLVNRLQANGFNITKMFPESERNIFKSIQAPKMHYYKTKEEIEEILYKNYLMVGRKLDYMEIGLIEGMPHGNKVKKILEVKSMNEIWSKFELRKNSH